MLTKAEIEGIRVKYQKYAEYEIEGLPDDLDLSNTEKTSKDFANMGKENACNFIGFMQVVAVNAMYDMPTLLDALEAAEKRAELCAEQRKNLNDQVNKLIGERDDLELALEVAEGNNPNCAECIAEEGFVREKIAADRDRLKARCEALERAIRDNCNYCVNYLQDKLTEECWNRRHGETFQGMCIGSWQFDEARFSESEDKE